MQADFRKLLEALAREGVQFVIVGGVAVVAHGHVRATDDLDISYARTTENFERLVRALAPFHPRLRGAPAELPFIFDARTLKAGLNFTLTTDHGNLDLIGEMTGVGDFQHAVQGAPTLRLYGHDVRVVSLDVLERAKQAAGRAKDLLDLEAIRVLKARGAKH